MFTSLNSMMMDIGVVLIIVTIVGLLGFSFVRMGRFRDELEAESDQSRFFTAYLKSDPRISFWVWSDGRMEGEPSLVSMLKLKGEPTHLDDLKDCLPLPLLQELQEKPVKNGVKATPVTVRREDDIIDMIVEYLPIVNGDMSWPVKIVWLEEITQEKDIANVNLSGVRVLEHRLSALLLVMDKLPLPVWQREADGRLSHVNNTYAQFVGAADSNQAIKDNLSLFELAANETFSDKVAHILETGKTVREHRFAVVHGQRRAFSLTHSPLTEINAVLSVALDVTTEEEAMSELSRVIESQAETLNRLTSPVAIFGPDRVLKFCNQAFQKMAELSESSLQQEISHGDLLEEMRAARRLPEQANFQEWKNETLKQYTELLESKEEMWHMPQGSIYRVLTQPHPLGGLLILFEDMTDHLALEGSYNTLIAVHQETLENLHEAVVVFGADGRVQLFNSGLADVWSLGAEPKAGTHLSDYIEHLSSVTVHVPGSKGFYDRLGVWVAERQSRAGRWYRKDGHVIDFTMVPLPDGAMLLTQVDVTDSFRIEQALRERSQALEEADRLKSEFITNVSYELRTPLNTIIGFGELLETGIYGAMSDKQKENMGHILSAASDLKDMITDVLDLAVMEAGEMELELETFDIQSAFDDVRALVDETLRRHRMELIIDCGSIDRPIEADIRRIKQALFNIIMTSSKLDATSRQVKLVAADKGDMLCITVSVPDSYMDSDVIDESIAAFSRGSTVSLRGLTGFDLALVRSIAKLHEGSVSLKPDEQGSLAVELQLPWTLKTS